MFLVERFEFVEQRINHQRIDKNNPKQDGQSCEPEVRRTGSRRESERKTCPPILPWSNPKTRSPSAAPIVRNARITNANTSAQANRKCPRSKSAGARRQRPAASGAR